MGHLNEKIDREVSLLPPEFQAEVIDFIAYLNERRRRDKTWLEQAWGAAPDFPDRVQQPPLSDVQNV